MRMSSLENVYCKNKSEKSFKAYKKQKNFCSRLFFNNFNLYSVTHNKLFWKAIKPFFSNEGNYRSQTKLVEKDDVLDEDDLIGKELKDFFKNAMPTLNIKENSVITNRKSDDQTILLIL